MAEIPQKSAERGASVSCEASRQPRSSVGCTSRGSLLTEPLPGVHVEPVLGPTNHHRSAGEPPEQPANKPLRRIGHKVASMPADRRIDLVAAWQLLRHDPTTRAAAPSQRSSDLPGGRPCAACERADRRWRAVATRRCTALARPCPASACSIERQPRLLAVDSIILRGRRLGAHAAGYARRRMKPRAPKILRRGAVVRVQGPDGGATEAAPAWAISFVDLGFDDGHVGSVSGCSSSDDRVRCAELVAWGVEVSEEHSLIGDLGMEFSGVDRDALDAAPVEVVIEWNARLPEFP